MRGCERIRSLPMSETADRYRKVTDQFLERAKDIPAEAWDQPSPCEGWSARDVVRHLVDTSAMFAGPLGADTAAFPSVDDDPVRAFTAARDAILGPLGKPEMATQTTETPMGPLTLEQLVSMFGIPDVVVHMWDVAQATGIDDSLDAEEVKRLYEQMLPMDAMVRQIGVFGPRVEVPEDADDQTKFIAFTGRRPIR